MKRLTHMLEYVGLRAAFGLIDRVSHDRAARTVSWLADVVYLADRPRRRVACENVLRAGIAATPKEADRIAKASFRHFAIMVLEGLQFSQIFGEDGWRDRVDMDIAPEAADVLRDPNRGAILISGHVGSWSVAGHALSHIKPVVAIAKNMSNPYTDRLLKERQPSSRLQLISNRDADITRFPSILKEGRILALMMDQYAQKRGMVVDFLGRPASTHTSPAMLHLVSRAPLLFGYAIRTAPLTYRLCIHPPIIRSPSGDRRADVRGILEQLNRELERVIRTHPEQYLWAHRRWRNK